MRTVGILEGALKSVSISSTGDELVDAIAPLSDDLMDMKQELLRLLAKNNEGQLAVSPSSNGSENTGSDFGIH